MNKKEMLELFEDVRDQYVMEALGSRRAARGPRKWALVAAAVALGGLLMGSGWALYMTWDQKTEIAAVEIAREDVHLSVIQAGPRGATLSVKIDGVDSLEESVEIHQGPVALEQKTDTGWEPVEQRQEDPEQPEYGVLTNGKYEYAVWWGTVYGLLEPGDYRLRTVLLEGHEPYSAEFEIAGEMESTQFQTAAELLEGDSYHVRYSEEVEYVPLADITEEDLANLKAHQEEIVFYQYEFLKQGEDLMELTYLDGELYMGVMYRDGVKYKLTNEDPDTHLSPIVGWEVWPDYDLNRITWWTDVLLEEGQELAYNQDGSLRSVTTRTSKESTSFRAMYQVTKTVELLSTEEKDISERFEVQNVNFFREFSWAEDREAFPAVDAVFHNVEPMPIETAADAIALAKKECTVDYSQIRVYRDEAAGMWKVEFQVLYGHQGYQFVYLDDQGITQRIAEAVRVWEGEADIPFAG